MMKESKAFTEATELLLHQFAYGCYNHGHYDKATRTFRVLAAFRPTTSRYWYGLGASLLAAGVISEAVQAFQLATIHNPKDPRSRTHLAECLAREGKKDEAMHYLSEAEGLLCETPDQTLQEQLNVIKGLIKQEEAPCQKK